MKRVLVTGGRGFIGSHLVDDLVYLGHHVGIFDNSTRKPAFGQQPHAVVSFHGDITKPDDVRHAVNSFNPDVVYHLAAQTSVKHSWDKPRDDMQVNVAGTINLLQAMQELKPLSQYQFGFTSSGGTVYGSTMTARETDRTDPKSPYAISKVGAEMYIRWFAERHGMKTIIFRLANVYGPRQDPSGECGVIATFSNQMLQRQQATINGNGIITRDYIFVNDVMQYLRLLPMKLDAEDVLCNTYNIGTGRATDLATLSRLCRNFCMDELRLRGHTNYMIPECLTGPLRPGDLMSGVNKTAKAKKAFGFTPETGLHDGLKATIKWFADSLGIPDKR